MSKTHLQRIVLCASLVLISTPAWANEGWYAGIKGGVGGGADAELGSAVNLDAEIGPAIMGVVGHAIGNGVRLEGEISWRTNDVDISISDIGKDIANDFLGTSFTTDQYNTFLTSNSDTSLENLAFMVNGAYDFQNNSSVTPFIMGGIGFSIVTGTIKVGGLDLGDDDDTVFAYQFGAGLAYRITQSVSVDVSYRFFGTTEPEFDVTTEVNNTHHNGLVGLTYSF